MHAARLSLFVPLFSLLVMAGCGGGDKATQPVVPPSDGLPAGTPAADSQPHLAQRLEKTLEWKVEVEYAKLLTNDFRYGFSVASDPVLVNQFPNWGRTDELAAMTHLFHGFTNAYDEVVPGATSIDLALNGVQYTADPDHADSTAQYGRIIITNLDGTIVVPGATEPITYQISARHEFRVVRGDAGVLPDGAIADSTRWYLRRWDDLSTGIAYSKGPVINPATPHTFGSIRARYR
jgi:hypothetical protein